MSKLCQNCRFMTEDFWGLKCSHPDVPLKDLANGERDYAAHVRRRGKCGPEGKFYEVKPPPPPHIPWHVKKLWQLSKWLEKRTGSARL